MFSHDSYNKCIKDGALLVCLYRIFLHFDVCSFGTLQLSWPYASYDAGRSPFVIDEEIGKTDTEGDLPAKKNPFPLRLGLNNNICPGSITIKIKGLMLNKITGVIGTCFFLLWERTILCWGLCFMLYNWLFHFRFIANLMKDSFK